MSQQTNWLQNYYGQEWLEKLHPVVYQDGVTYAIVRITDKTTMGFVLVRKNGKHGITSQKSLHEGPLTPEVQDRMYKALSSADFKGSL